ncbi:hypothetical protein [Actinoplanes rectilineatus]|uniref:hypothetical protein n=1 Tax=Actinoplanes rectilineatus TaxID=113571 RepID=UPI0005F2E059|nr:hypothetical protein [Actinoplanes rectilineatus]
MRGQQILTITSTLTTVLHRLGTILPGWKRDALTPDVTAFTSGPDGYITVRASGTETGLYVEAPEESRWLITRELSA